MFMVYRRRPTLVEMEPYDGQNMTDVSISAADREAGCPMVGDMIARDHTNSRDRWLVNGAFFDKHYLPEPEGTV